MKLYTDGGCTNNQNDPTKRQMRIVVADETGMVLAEHTMKGGSNNIAELWAVAEALVFANGCGIGDLDLYTDSQNTLAWLDGNVGKKLNDRVAVMNLLHTINTLRERVRMTVTWIRRENNLAGIYIEENAVAAPKGL
jgi:ribonuclease HI